ncbi:hypothetical protein KY289_031630 [Solanum tuberosum]|nr:hypothetical protein KY289_031630 [Solanum tuberosum]
MPILIILCAIWRYKRQKDEDKGRSDVEMAAASGARGLRDRNMIGLAEAGRAVLEGDPLVPTRPNRAAKRKVSVSLLGENGSIMQMGTTATQGCTKSSKILLRGLDFSINVCTHRWAELQSGPLKLALMHSSSDIVVQKGYSSLLSFTVDDINNSVTKLLALGAELDGPIKYEIHGKVAALRCVDGHMLGLYQPSQGILETTTCR